MNPEGIWILVVEDDPVMAQMCERALRAQGYQVHTCPDGTQAMECLAARPYDLVLTDVRLPGMDGMALLEAIRARYPQTTVILMTAYADIEAAVRAVEAGAFDYLPKPFSRDQLRTTVQRALEYRQLLAENQEFRRRLEQVYELPYAFADLVGQSPAFRSVIQQALKVAPSTVSVLITGESGTGKERLARAIHRASPRADGPFVVVDCASIPETLLESELFGYEPGAFTGATHRKKGLIEMAHGGTLFFDEIGELPPYLQAKLLRVLQERRLRRLGGSEEIPVDFRLIAATHRDLAQMVREGRFREDLWFRIHVVTLHIPPLRERREDILLLAHYFLNELNQRGGRRVEGFTSAALLILQAYAWPGNVRELRNVIEYAHAMGEGPWITPLDLPPELLRTAPTAWPEEEPTPWPESILLKPFYEARREVLARFERAYFRQLLQRAQGRISTAARMADLHRAVLYRFLRKHRLVHRRRKPEEGGDDGVTG
jgi:DNA-binding NtrC family response regulator